MINDSLTCNVEEGIDTACLAGLVSDYVTWVACLAAFYKNTSVQSEQAYCPHQARQVHRVSGRGAICHLTSQ